VLEEQYDDGSTKLVMQGLTVSPQKLNKAGTQTVTVAYGDYIMTYSVKVTYSLFQRFIRIFLFGFIIAWTAAFLLVDLDPDAGDKAKINKLNKNRRG